VGQLVHAGRRVDEVVVLGRETSLEVHGHGSPLVTEELGAALGAARDTTADAALAGAARSLRGVRALASALDGPLAPLLAAVRAGEPGVGRSAEFARAIGLLDFGARLAEPARVRLVGRPNAGKSTLFNRLTGGDRALVSPREGTTRDTVAHEILVAGVPVRLEDAAGATLDAAPIEGADLLVQLLRKEDEEPLPPGAPSLRVLGRADLHPGPRAPGTLAVSGLTGLGCARLMSRVAEILGLERPSEDDLWTPVRASDRALLRSLRDS